MRKVVLLLAGLTASTTSLVSFSMRLTVTHVLFLLFAASFLWMMGVRMSGGGNYPCENRTTNRRGTRDRYVDAIIVVLVGVIAGYSFVSWTGSGPSTRLSAGPDNIGLLAASQVLTEGYTMETIETTAFNSVDSRSQYSSLDDERMIYRVPIFKIQIAAEFLNLGLRWGMASFVAFLSLLVRQPPGLIIGMMMIFLPIVLATQMIRLFHHYRFDRGLRLLGTLMLFANPLFLRVVIEGGLQQLYATIFFFELLISFVVGNKSLTTVASRFLLFTCGFVVYSDLGLILSPVFFALMFLEKLESVNRTQSENRFIWKKPLNGLFLGSHSLLTLGFFFAFINYIPRRFTDSSIGGWPQPPDPSFFQLLGFNSPYSSRWQASEHVFDGRATAALIIIDVFLIAVGIIQFQKISDFNRRLLFGGSVIIAGAGTISVYILVLLKVRLVDQTFNYQSFKAASYALPFVIPGTLYLWSNIQPRLKYQRLVISVAAFGMLVHSLGTWTSEIPTRTSTFSVNAISKSQQETLDKISEFNVIGTPTLKYVSFVSLTDAGVFKRGGGVEQDMNSVRERELLFLIDLDLCDASCKDLIDRLQDDISLGDFVGIPLGESKMFEENNFNDVRRKMESLGFDIERRWGIKY